MIKKIAYIILGLLGIVSIAIVNDYEVSASPSVQVRPLIVKDKLKVAEAKKGYIDIANPSDESITVKVSVEAFRQIDNQGNIEFFQSKEIAAGLRTDLEEFSLEPREALRMYYQADGRKLPPGDIFGVIFFSVSGAEGVGGVGESARVGSLIVLENGTPGSRRVNLDIGQISPIHLGEAIEGQFRLHNPANPQTTSGFFPEVTLGLQPFNRQTRVDGPLLMAGVSRQVEFSMPTNRIGLYRLSITAGETTGYRWIVVITGWWRWIVLVLIPLAIIGTILVIKRRHKSKISFSKPRLK